MGRLLSICLVVAALGLPEAAPAGQRDSRLDGLFAQLRATTDAAEARRFQKTIWRIWIDAGEARVDAEMRRGIEAMQHGRHTAALAHFDAVVELAPDHAEGWNKRATLYMMGEFDASVRDIERTLALEPRHWGALSGLGLIQMALGRLEAALKAFESAVAINPHLLGTQLRIRQLREAIRRKAI